MNTNSSKNYDLYKGNFAKIKRCILELYQSLRVGFSMKVEKCINLNSQNLDNFTQKAIESSTLLLMIYRYKLNFKKKVLLNGLQYIKILSRSHNDNE